MEMIRSVYHCGKRLESGLENTVRRQMAFRDINRYIKRDRAETPELTEQQVLRIRQFWDRYGIAKLPTQWHRYYYAKTGIEDPAFIPSFVFSQIIKPKLNDMSFSGVWSDKAYLDFFLRDVTTPVTIVRNVSGRFLNEKYELINAGQAQAIMDCYEEIVVKPAVFTATGKGVELIRKPFSIERILKSHRANFVIQLPLKQHADMERLNPSSVNTIRINSVLFDTEARVMSAFVKVGQAGEFADNSGRDRYFIGVREDGTYVNYAIDREWNKYSDIPCGYQFAGQPVPCYDQICRMIQRAHTRVAHFGLAFWDVGVREDGVPVVVEMNLRSPVPNVPQVALGPFFGRYTEDILKYIAR